MRARGKRGHWRLEISACFALEKDRAPGKLVLDSFALFYEKKILADG